MAEKNKCSIHLDTESVSFGTETENPSISDQSAPTSNTGQLEEPPEDIKTANTSKDVRLDSPPKSSLPPPTDQSEHSSSRNLKKSVVEPESSESAAQVPLIPETTPLAVSVSNEEQRATFCAETMPKLIENTSSAITDRDQLSLLLPPFHQHGQDMQADSGKERTPSTSRNESLRQMKQQSDDGLVEQVQRLELEAKTESSEGESKSPPEGFYVKPKGNNDKTWELPFRVRKTGLLTVWNEPDEDFVPNLALRKNIPATASLQQYEETFQGTPVGLQCQQCQRAIFGDSSDLLCQRCLVGLRKVASEPEGACGGATSDPHHSQEGATAASYEEFPTSYSDFRANYERMSSVEQYIRMRHRQREGLPPYDKPPEETTSQQLDAYGDYERSDSEEDYQRMQNLNQDVLEVLSTTQRVLFDRMRRTESEIFAAMSRPGETFDDLRNPEQEIREAEHYDRMMAILAARYGGAPLEETTFPWTPQEFFDQETLYEMWGPPPEPVEKDEMEDMSPETRRRHELERMALMRKPREQLEEMLMKDESEESGSEDTEYSEVSTPSGSTD